MSTSLPGDAAEHAAIRAGAPVCGRLPQHGLLRFAGPDAASFLQGQLSNDVRPLSEGMPVLAAYS
ncbi:MAG: Aminomethyltransferase folate-binding domain, partial [Gammaproteobacteria bacterium]|nr:Aminomethyltransferase folate-binding domain [Gammaproteobacteria bacterium]